MTGTINGTRYFNLLMANGITGAELDTEWASAGSLGAFLYLWNRSQYRNQLSKDYVAFSILSDSDYFQDNINRTRGYVMGSTSMQAFRFADETALSLGSGYTGLAQSNMATAGYRQSALYCKSITKMYKYNWVNQSYYEETNDTFSASSGDNYKFHCSTDDEGYFLGSNSPDYDRDLKAWNYANNTSQDTSNVLAVGGFRGASCESSTHAYFFGGQLSSGTYRTEIQGLVKATKTGTNTSETMLTGRHDGAGSESATDCYIFGGTTGADTNSIEKYNISGDTQSAVSDTLTNAKTTGAFRNNDYDIYLMGSNTQSETEIEKFNVSTDTISTLSATRPTSSTIFDYSAVAGGGAF